MEELGKVGFLNYRLFLTGWDNNIVSSNKTLIPILNAKDCQTKDNAC
jgi:hypothetical protein